MRGPKLRNVLRLLVVCGLAAALLVPPGSAGHPAQAATRAGVGEVEDAKGDFLASGEFHSGLSYYHANGEPGPGVNAFEVTDRCDDGFSPTVVWIVEGTRYSKTLSDKCTLFPHFRNHDVQTGFARKSMVPMHWYVRAENAQGRTYGSTVEADTMGTYSYKPKSELFVHSSVYRDQVDQLGRTVVVSLVPTSKLTDRPGSDLTTFVVWHELQQRTPVPSDLNKDQRQSLYKQLACHVLYAKLGRGGPTWDLEVGRKNIAWDMATQPHYVLHHGCNWGPDLPGPDPDIPPGDGDDIPVDQPPTVDAGPDVSGDEGAPVKLAGSAEDDHGAPDVKWTYRPREGVDKGATCEFSNAGRPGTRLVCTDDGTFEVTLTADDGVNAPVSDSALVRLDNVAPKVTLDGPEEWDVHRVGDKVALKAPFEDPGSNDTHTCTVRWDDGKKSSFPAKGDSCDVSHAYPHAGMNTISVEVADDDGGRDRAETMIVVYDPRAGLLTGAGRTDDGLRFTTAAKYPAADSSRPLGAVVLSPPSGDGPRTLVSTRLDWLVITPDGKAAVKGEATGHGFLGYVKSGEFRGVVWPLSEGKNPPEKPLYDSSPGQSWDVDRARLRPVTTGATVIDAGWIPGLPDLPGPLSLGRHTDRLPVLGVETGPGGLESGLGVETGLGLDTGLGHVG
ncbi:PKD domain-containing protein [Streptomyces boluensis]|uniref:PKD domain-containing protein n=1 Tax=Streptomyces boluensis TaxID=1775135 RepID=A0A964UP97_9ACTN|nr:PKD domain-containing protein [Streptomyces boluensis]NBE52819.1 hypothetical protein [Streptomyces boluensis]